MTNLSVQMITLNTRTLRHQSNKFFHALLLKGHSCLLQQVYSSFQPGQILLQNCPQQSINSVWNSNFPATEYEIDGSSPYSQQTINCAKSCPSSIHTIFLKAYFYKIHFNIIQPPISRSLVSALQISLTQILHSFPSYLRATDPTGLGGWIIFCLPMDKRYLGDQGVDGRIILRWIFRKWEVGVCTGSSWLRIGTGGGHLWMR